MLRHWFLGVTLAGVLALSMPLFSGQGKGHGKGNPHNNAADDRDDDRWERHGDYEYRIYDKDDGVPPGWSKGKKTGWGNCGLPPGQAKKYGCQSYRYEGRDYYFYHDDAGRIVIRRPTIHLHGGIDAGIDVH